MKKYIEFNLIWQMPLLFFFLTIMEVPAFSQQAFVKEKKLKDLEKEVRVNLTTNILPYWSGRMIDEVNGGFYGRIDGGDKVYPDAVKGGILNARILWTFSAAFRILKDSAYLRIATRAKDYILSHFIDKQFGGAYLSLKSNGEPQDSRKQTYTQAFFIYALSEYYLASGNKESLRVAKEIYNLLEKYSFDKKFNGYFEAYSREWNRIKDKMIGEKTENDQKGMNTHLHILEAYANLYLCSGDERVGKSLRNLVELFNDRIVDKNSYHLINFLNEKWESTSPVQSYGHDIEASWLIVEAAHLVKDPILTEKTEKLSLKMVKAASEGLQADGSMIYEKDTITGVVNENRQWWPQAETVIGFVNAFQMTGDESYLLTAVNTWKYIDKNFVDHKNGEWFNSISGSRSKGRGDKGGFWKCPYHNSRMCMEIIQRASY